MGVFKKLWKKLSEGFFYIVDIDVFRNYLQNEIQFSEQNDLGAGVDLNIYVNGEKHQITTWNYSASESEDENRSGTYLYYDEREYAAVDDLIFCELQGLPTYFRIELNLADSVYLEPYKEMR